MTFWNFYDVQYRPENWVIIYIAPKYHLTTFNTQLNHSLSPNFKRSHRIICALFGLPTRKCNFCLHWLSPIVQKGAIMPNPLVLPIATVFVYVHLLTLRDRIVPVAQYNNDDDEFILIWPFIPFSHLYGPNKYRSNINKVSTKAVHSLSLSLAVCAPMVLLMLSTTN